MVEIAKGRNFTSRSGENKIFHGKDTVGTVF